MCFYYSCEWKQFSVGTELMTWELYCNTVCIRKFYDTEIFSPTHPFHNVRACCQRWTYWLLKPALPSSPLIIILPYLDQMCIASATDNRFYSEDIFTGFFFILFYFIIFFFFYFVVCLSLTSQRKEKCLCLKNFKEWGVKLLNIRMS